MVDDKLQPGERDFNESLLSKHGGRVTHDWKNADVVATELRGSQRLSRHLPDRSIWPTKTFVKIQWITDSIAHEKQMDFASYALDFVSPPSFSSSPVKATLVSDSQARPRAKQTEVAPFPTYSIEELRAKYNNSIYSCQRYSPLHCLNEALVK